MAESAPMRILLTGQAGYIGAVMTRVLLEAGHKIVGLDTEYFDGCDLGRFSADVSQIRKDIRDIGPRDLEGFDAVVHLAALCNDPLGDLNPELTMDINHQASLKLAQSAKEAGVKRFIYSSSCSMYGAAGESVLDEEAELRPLTAYAISKVRVEEDVRKLASPGFSPVFMRNATAYGASPRFRADIVLNNLVCWAFATGKVRIMSDGTPWRPIVHVEDISQAFAAALSAPVERIHNQAFNVGSDEQNYQVRDLAEIVRQVVPGCSIEYAGTGGPDPRSYRVNFAKIRRYLPEFQPRWDARKGAVELYEACSRAAMKLGDFDGGPFIRLAQLKKLLESGKLNSDLRWQ